MNESVKALFSILVFAAIVLAAGCQDLPSDQVKPAIVKDIEEAGGRVTSVHAIGDFCFDSLGKELDQPVAVVCESEEVLNLVIDRRDELPMLSKFQLMSMHVSVQALKGLTDVAETKTLRFDRCTFEKHDGPTDQARSIGIGSLHLTRMSNEEIANALSLFDSSKLKILVLDGSSPSTAIATNVSELENLKLLSLRVGESVSELVSEFRSNSIQALDLSDTIVDVEKLRLDNLHNLRHLNLRRTSLSADEIFSLVNDRNLQNVFVDDEHVDSLRSRLENTEIHGNDMFVFRLLHEELSLIHI